MKRLVVETARHDRLRAEKVCLLHNGQIAEALNKRFNAVIVGADCFDKGEIVMDSRGKGSLQLPDDYLDWELAVF